MLELQLRSGVVNASIFILFDIILIGIFDFALAKFVCYLYFRAIYAGKAIYIYSTDVPGVTNYLVGNLLSPINIFMLIAKVAFIVCIFVVNLSVNDSAPIIDSPQLRTASFDLEPSDRSWIPLKDSTVQRSWIRARGCREVDGDRVMYYRLTFNLSNGVVLTNDSFNDPFDFEGRYPIDSSSIDCQSPAFVRVPLPLATVIGCSTLQRSSCGERTRVARTADVRMLSVDDIGFSITSGSATATFEVLTYDDKAAQLIWPEYPDPSVECVRTRIGSTEASARFYTPCLLISKTENKSQTLVERWNYEPSENSASFVRYFPGPVFDGDYNIGRYQTWVNLQDFAVNRNWIEESGTLVADALIFRGEAFNYVRYGTGPTVVSIPVSSIVCAVLCTVVAAAAYIYITVQLRSDDRPRFNTVNGLSSILREECQPSGNSFRAGTWTSLGLSRKDSEVLHFGPLFRSADSIPRGRRDEAIE